MSEISELISLLDERGVEWNNAPTWILRWRDSEHREAKAVGFSNGLLCSAYLTPEQAVEATLGRGTCEILGYDDGYDEGVDGEMYQYADARHFLSCGHEAYGSRTPKYCPECGAKVVDE